MRELEAKKLAVLLEEIAVERLSPLVEIGSSTKDFRENIKPHISRELHFPLKGRSVDIVTTDLKEGEGIDISGDFFLDEIREEIRKKEPKALLCSNILEHVESPKEFLKNCDKLLPFGEILIVTVPYSFPYHAHPIDTMFRPSPEELEQLLPNYKKMYSGIHIDTTYWQDLKKQGFIKMCYELFLKWPARILVPAKSFKLWSRRLERLQWLNKEYKVTILIAEKVSA